MKVKFVVASLLVATSASAEFWDGNKLLSRLRGEDTERAIALGYVMGVSDTMQGINHCPPENATAGQMRDIVRNYLANTPAQRHLSADVLTLTALEIAFPCANKNQRGGRSL